MERSQDFIDHAQAARQEGGRGIHVADTADLARVSRLAAFLERDLAEVAGLAGLKSGQFQVLAELRGRDPLPMTRIRAGAGDRSSPPAGMTPVLDGLEERGLIHRQIDPEDRRARRIIHHREGPVPDQPGPGPADRPPPRAQCGPHRWRSASPCPPSCASCCWRSRSASQARARRVSREHAPLRRQHLLPVQGTAVPRPLRRRGGGGVQAGRMPLAVRQSRRGAARPAGARRTVADHGQHRAGESRGRRFRPGRDAGARSGFPGGARPVAALCQRARRHAHPLHGGQGAGDGDGASHLRRQSAPRRRQGAGQGRDAGDRAAQHALGAGLFPHPRRSRRSTSSARSTGRTSS